MRRARPSRSARLPHRARTVVGVDVGGTFTDIVVFDGQTKAISVLKVPTSRVPASAILEGLARLAVPPAETSMVTHSTTVATNALLTREGLAKAALITNEGFRDVLEIGRQRRPELYNLNVRRPMPLVERKHRLTVKCRVGSDGHQVEPLDSHEASVLAAAVVRGAFDAVAVSFLNSYLNPAHEEEMRRALVRAGFRGHISLSSEVDRRFREYERTSTTVVNAVLSPLVSRYLTGFERSLRSAGFVCPLYVMNSDGGTSTMRFASSRPVVAIESGPAAGVVASCLLARRLSMKDALTFDMGGTTAKAGTVVGGEPEFTTEFEAAGKTHSGRSIVGSGYPVRGSFIDLAEVSAGGGTIAREDSGDLRVGPESAGSFPGPACYGKGGTEPTVTDANLALGRLNPHAILGGKMPLDADAAARSLSRLADRLGWSASETAKGILLMVNSNMSKAISIVSSERGRDPREFTLFAFGGAGPMHACDLADGLGVRSIVVPVHAGLFSARGLLGGELSRTFTSPPKEGVPLEDTFRRLESEARSAMAADGFVRPKVRRYAEARYRGQSHEILVPFTGTRGALTAEFGRRHKEVYGFSAPEEVEVVSVLVRAVTPGVRIGAARSEWSRDSASPQKRRAWVGGEDRSVPVFTRESMRRGDHGRGPCIIEEYDSTTVVNPGWRWNVEGYGTRMDAR